MLGIDYGALASMVSRMESVARSMDESSRRVEAAAEKMSVSTAEITVELPKVHLDPAAIRQAVLAEMDRGKGRE